MGTPIIINNEVVTNMLKPFGYYEGIVLATACFELIHRQTQLHDSVLTYMKEKKQKFYYYVQN